jgi:hypothetical protein
MNEDDGSRRMDQNRRRFIMKTVIGEASITGIMGGLFSGIISALLNYRILPFPETIPDNVIGHGFSGFFCGFISGLVGVLIYHYQHQ